MQEFFSRLFGLKKHYKLRAQIDQVEVVDDRISIVGSVFHETHPINTISIMEQDNILTSGYKLTLRPDVQAAYPQHRYAKQSGIHFEGRLAHPIQSLNHPFRIVAAIDGLKPETFQFSYLNEEALAAIIPLPPSHLRTRVRGYDRSFLRFGCAIYSDLKTQIEKHRAITSFNRVLDWGCGCSQVLRFLLDDVPASKVYGCDIDSEAIDWDIKSVPGPSFNAVSHIPPTPYTDGYFDLIYGISVFTHLNEKMQYLWLEELRRITAPNGIVAVSVHGPAICPPDLNKTIRLKGGFLDNDSDQAAEFAPFSDSEYYRVTFHHENYIRANWSRYFKVIDIIDRGINGYQDLVILERTS